MTSFESFRSLELPEETREKRYTVEPRLTVEVAWKKFSPEAPASQEKRSDNTVVFLPGWAMPVDGRSIRNLVQGFAEESGTPSYAVTTSPEKETEDSLYKQAQAVSQFIKERGLKEVTLAGHSQGGDKAIDLTTILQNDPEIKINGLILLDSVGLHEQRPYLELTKNFAKDAIVNTPVTVVKELWKNPALFKKSGAAFVDIITGWTKEIWRSKFDYLKDDKLRKQVQQMAKANPRMREIKVPVIIMSGAEDSISDPEKIVPEAEEQKIIDAWEADKKSGYIDPREEYLKRNLFPNSPYVRMFIPEKIGHHGLPLFRSESVARASLYLLERARRHTKRGSSS